ITLKPAAAALAQRADAIAADARCGAGRVATPRRVLVDYGGPNVAKPMHVGHLRASIIGEAIKRLYRFRGDEVLGDAHFGDWGFQMGLLITAVLDEDAPLADLMATYESDPSEANAEALTAQLSEAIALEDLDRPYPAASERARSGAAYRARPRGATAELQGGRPGYRLIWRHFADVTRAALTRDFHALGIDFDLWKGESDVNDLIEPMVAELKQKGLVFPDQ